MLARRRHRYFTVLERDEGVARESHKGVTVWADLPTFPKWKSLRQPGARASFLQRVDDEPSASAGDEHVPMSSSPFTTLGNYLKPYPNEAFLRLRSSSLALVAAFLFTNLLPVPTPFAAWIAVTTSDETGLIWWGFSCIGKCALSSIYA